MLIGVIAACGETHDQVESGSSHSPVGSTAAEPVSGSEAAPTTSGTSGAPLPDGATGSGGTSSGGTSGAEDPGTGTGEPPGVCMFKPDGAPLAVDCGQIARIVPIGIGVSEAHVARRHLRLEDAAGAALGPEFHACLGVLDSACEPAPVALAAAPSQAITGLLVRPEADPKANAALIAALTSFIDARPKGEAIAVFRWGAAVTQISTPTAEKGRLHRLVASGLQPLEGEGLPIGVAVEAVADPLVTVRHDSHLSLRQLIVVAPGHAPVQPEALALNGYTAPLRVELVAAAEVEPALLEASARLDAAIAAGELLIRECALSGLTGLVLHVAGGGPSLALAEVAVAGVDQVEGPLTCDPADDQVAPLLPDVIEIDFSPEERVVHESRVAELSKDPFLGSLRTNLNAPGIHAQVKLRLHGQGSLKCQRKSLGLSLKDDAPRQWLAGSGLDKFMLVSMCKDDRYLSQHTANLLMAELGLFAPKFRMVELVIDGESQGAYLLLEKPETTLERGSTHPRSILRRRPDIQGVAPELKFTATDETMALAPYDELLAEAGKLHGTALLEWLDQSMDLDQYLRWIALMSLLQSGDYIDEVYFMSTDITTSDGSVGDFFSISTWDQDDIFKPCHDGGMNALIDPHGLTNCAESVLDHAIFADPKLYKRYAATLKDTRAWLDQATFDAAIQATEDRVLEILAGDAARGAMVELLKDKPAAIDFEVAKAEVLARGAKLRQLFADRRALLGEQLAAYDKLP